MASVEDVEHFRSPLMSKTDRNMSSVRELALANKRITVLEVANMLGISFGSV
jgi:hypothetical protein